MARQINCFACGIYLGEVRDAKLRKNTEHVCQSCKSSLLLAKAQAEANSRQSAASDFISQVLRR